MTILKLLNIYTQLILVFFKFCFFSGKHKELKGEEPHEKIYLNMYILITRTYIY